MKKILIFIALSAAFCISANPVDKICRISGNVAGRSESKEAVIIEADEDFRVVPSIKVPIIDGHFSLQLPADTVRQYQMLFDDEIRHGSWRSRYFFAEGDSVSLKADGEDKFMVISDSPENRRAKAYDDLVEEKYGARRDSLDAEYERLEQSGDLYAEPFKTIFLKAQAAKNDAERDSLMAEARKIQKNMNHDILSKACKKQQEGYDSLLADMQKLQEDFVAENVSIYGLAVMKRKLIFLKSDKNGGKWAEIFKKNYADTLTWHPYSGYVSVLADGVSIVPGNLYPDYTLTRPDGTTEQVASLIKGAPAVIDLWASWCGPCRRHSKELIPVYEKYAPFGFNVVAVAKEDADLSAMNEAIAKDGYPWESFVDIADRDKVWARNGCASAGGRIVLLDDQGRIVAVDPEIHAIAEYLKTFYADKGN